MSCQSVNTRLGERKPKRFSGARETSALPPEIMTTKAMGRKSEKKRLQLGFFEACQPDPNRECWFVVRTGKPSFPSGSAGWVEVQLSSGPRPSFSGKHARRRPHAFWKTIIRRPKHASCKSLAAHGHQTSTNPKQAFSFHPQRVTPGDATIFLASTLEVSRPWLDSHKTPTLGADRDKVQRHQTPVQCTLICDAATRDWVCF